MLNLGLDQPEKKYRSGDHALIIGAGLAGCATAYVLARMGFHCKIYDAAKTASAGASELPAAVYRPYVSIGQSVVNDYFSNAFEYLLAELKSMDQSLHEQRGLLQLISHPEKWLPGKHWSVETSTAASEIANQLIDSAALYIKQAGALTPAILCSQWLQSSARIEFTANSPVSAIKETSEGWQLTDNAGCTIGEGQLVILANSNGINHLLDRHQLPLVPVRGQISHFKTQHRPPRTAPLLAAKGYLIPSHDGYWAGATHQRNLTCRAATATDDQLNLAMLKSLAPTIITVPTAEKSWAGIRCTTPDRMPVIGGIPDATNYKTAYRDLHHGRKNQQFPPAASLPGAYVIAGFGSRGATQALYAAECLASIITGNPSTTQSILSAIHPARFLMRQLRKRPTNKR